VSALSALTSARQRRRRGATSAMSESASQVGEADAPAALQLPPPPVSTVTHFP